MIKTRNSRSGFRVTSQNIGQGSIIELPEISKQTDRETLITNLQTAMEILVQTGDTWSLMEVLRKVKQCTFRTFPEVVQMMEYEKSFLKDTHLRMKISFLRERKCIVVSAMMQLHFDRTSITSSTQKQLSPTGQEVKNILIDLETAYDGF